MDPADLPIDDDLTLDDLSSVDDSPAKLAVLKKLKRRQLPPIIINTFEYVGVDIFKSPGNDPVPGKYLGEVAIQTNKVLPVVGHYFGQPVVMGLPIAPANGETLRGPSTGAIVLIATKR